MSAAASPFKDALVLPSQQDLQALVRPLLEGVVMHSGEPAWQHALGAAHIVQALGLDANAQAAALVFSAWWLGDDENAKSLQALAGQLPEAVITLATQVVQLLKLNAVSKEAAATPPVRGNKAAVKLAKDQLDTVRRMLLAMAPDIRVVLIRLASRLQTLRFYAAAKIMPPEGFARETLTIYAPLANRLGVWQLKWEMEDLAFRFQEPETYKRLAKALEEKRAERESFINRAMGTLGQALAEVHLKAEVAGRPKHIFSIHNKMRNKDVAFEELYDLRALRVIVDDIKDCYAALGVVHQIWTPLPREFDDYIARPKPNGYQSLHSVVITEYGWPLEVQIRTRAMHLHAEYGVAAHWRYKEGAGGKGASEQDQKIAWLRQLLAWKTDVSEAIADEHWQTGDDDRIYVLTPQGRVVELAKDATPIDFAYHLHTDLGHRCRGAKVDGLMVPLSTRLRTGQTVEIIADKKLGAGPSRDWLNQELGFLQSPRSRTKVRAWFNATEHEQATQLGRAVVERELQRLGKTAVNLQDLALKMGFEKLDELFFAASKPEFHPRSVETAFEEKIAEDPDALVRARVENLSEARKQTKGSVLVVGTDVLTQLAQCCKPSPPDAIAGFVTRGKGVSIHRGNCGNFKNLVKKDPARVIECSWGNAKDASYAADLRVTAIDRQGLLRDISEVLAKERINVTAVNTQSAKGQARMMFTVQIASGPQLDKALLTIAEVKGVLEARRR